MLAFAVPKQPSIDPMEILTQRMEEMQRSFTQQLQDLAGQLHPEKKKKNPTNNRVKPWVFRTITSMVPLWLTPAVPP
jgi:hypothetical protein